METVLIGGSLIDGTGREPMPGAGVVVKDGQDPGGGTGEPAQLRPRCPRDRCRRASPSCPA